VSLADRWNGYLRRRADAQAAQADLAAMRLGLLPDGWVYGRDDRRQAEFDEQRRILLELHKHLYREPVTGPDGIDVAIWYMGVNGPRSPLVALNTRFPSAPQDRLTPLVGYGVRRLTGVSSSSRLSWVVQAHAMSGPPAVISRLFLTKQDAADFAAELARQVRACGVAALGQDP
jgi:hypothetical protein